MDQDILQYIVVGFTALAASVLTFFSGFGLGTLLMPVMALFFEVTVAIALTGIVHLLNNFFKLALIGKHVNKTVSLRFGIPALLGAFAGAILLLELGEGTAISTYQINGNTFSITVQKIIIALLIVIFVMFDILPGLKKIQFGEKHLYTGGFASGFFGGLSGHQGALRTMFLMRCGLSKESFIATGILVACLVDLSRLGVYFSRMNDINLQENIILLLVAVLSAFTGAYFGKKLLKKVTLAFVQNFVSVMLLLLAAALGAGLI
jgi:uncharacterized membrane protein YfcA